MPSTHPDLPAALAQRIRDTLPGVQGVWLFGSRASGQEHRASDWDLAVLGASPFDPVAVFDLGLELGVQARRDVDLIDLRRAPLVLRNQVIALGRLIGTVDGPACEQFAQATREVYYAWLEEQRIVTDELRRAGLLDRRS